MTETASPMHSEAQGASQAQGSKPCDQCGTPFVPKRPWTRFCRTKCRNDWHSAMRPEAVKEARELVRLALEGCDPREWNPRARKLLGIK